MAVCESIAMLLFGAIAFGIDGVSAEWVYAEASPIGEESPDCLVISGVERDSWILGLYLEPISISAEDDVNGLYIRNGDRYEHSSADTFIDFEVSPVTQWRMRFSNGEVEGTMIGYCRQENILDCDGRRESWVFYQKECEGGPILHSEFTPICHWAVETTETSACEPSLHWVVAGKPTASAWNNVPTVECMANEQTLASRGSNRRGRPIAVTCCSDDGSVKRKFGDKKQCLRSKTYQEAYDLCDQVEDGDFRLCTLDEMRSGKTKGQGCKNDWRYNWVSTPCDVEGVTEVSAPMDGLAFNEVIGSDGAAASSSNALGPMVIGAAAGAALMAVIVAVVVAMRKRLSAKDSELEMADAVHVDDGHISHAASVTLSVSMDAVEVAANAETEKETEAEVEVVTATEMEAGSRNEC